MSTALKVVAWVLGSVVLLVLLGVGALWWGLSGGWDGIRPAARPDDRRVVQAGEDAVAPLAELTDPVEDALAVGGAGVGRVEVEGCEEGQNNWKVQDGYTLSCSRASVLGATSAAATPQLAATDVDERVRSLGWEPTEYGEMERRGASGPLEGRYRHPDAPDAVLVVEVTSPDDVSSYLPLSRVDLTGQEPAAPVLDALRASSQVAVVATVELTYFEDD